MNLMYMVDNFSKYFILWVLRAKWLIYYNSDNFLVKTNDLVDEPCEL